MSANLLKITDFFNQLENVTILVVGDVMIDAYLRGSVDRISPEAPVPVVALRMRENMLGGAANVALNINSVGANAILCSVIGTDKQGSELLSLLEQHKLSCSGILQSPHRITTTKYRIIGNKVQILRVDEEIDTDILPDEADQLLETIKLLIQKHKPGAILLQDYNKGVLSEKVIRGTIEIAAEYSIPVAVDPKKRNFNTYKNIALFKPNLKELKEGLATTVNAESIENLTEAAFLLHKEQNIAHVFITLSEKGVFLSSMNHEVQTVNRFLAIPRSITDVSGAGDTVISIAAICLAIGMDMEFTAKLSNIAGGIVCEQTGVVAIDKQVLKEEAITKM